MLTKEGQDVWTEEHTGSTGRKETQSRGRETRSTHSEESTAVELRGEGIHRTFGW